MLVGAVGGPIDVGWRVRLLAAVVVVGFALAVVVTGGNHLGVVISDAGVTVAAGAAAATCWFVAARREPTAARSWQLLGASSAAWAVGELVWSWQEVVEGRAVDFPGLADVGYLVAAPLAALALLALPGPPVSTLTRVRNALDGAILCGSVLMLGWIFMLEPAFRETNESFGARLLGATYPALDLLLLSLVATMLATKDGAGRRTLLCVGGAFLCIAISDTAYAILAESYTSGGLVDVGWMAGYVGLVVAAMSNLGSRPIGHARPGFLPIAFGLGAIACVMVKAIIDGQISLVESVIATGTVAATLARQAFALRENTVLSRNLEDKVAERTEELRSSEVAYRLLFEDNPEPMWVIARDDLRFLAVNAAAVDHYGWTMNEFLTLTVADVRPPEDEPAMHELLRSVDHIDAVPVRHMRKDGTLRDVELSLRRLEFSGCDALLTLVHDVSERISAEAALEHQALHDPLTGLPNRELLERRLELALSSARSSGTRVAVAFADLDRFKIVNDSLGHEAGDEVLTWTSHQLGTAIRPQDTVARLGGDEFVVLLNGIAGEAEALRLGWKLCAALRRPAELRGREVFVSSSIGVALSDEASTPGSLLRNADVAMYRAKERGRNRAELFDEAERLRVVARMETEGALRHALHRDELRVHHQPVVDLAARCVVGVEALVRWERPGYGLIGPADFVPVAEESGLIVDIGAWVLGAAVAQAATWAEAGTSLTLAVNLSAIQLAQPGILSQVRDVLEASQLPPSRLCLEVTETALAYDTEAASLVLGDLADLGVSIAVDDFGTGYSSLTYLRRFPVSVLKVDRSFVAGLGVDHGTTSLIAGVLELARSMGLATVAEGVETGAQADLLIELGCDRAQGHLWSPAVPSLELTAWLSAGGAQAAMAMPAA